MLGRIKTIGTQSSKKAVKDYSRTAKNRISCQLLSESMAFSVEETKSGAHLPRTPSHCEKDPEMKSTSQDAEMFI